MAGGPLFEKLRDEITRNGPISFERFMETALYESDLGYYRSAHDPFGRGGDFYTASQLQPVFGFLLRRAIESLTPHRTIADIGAGRGELRESFPDWRYFPVDRGHRFPEPFDGVVVANELFDALPCRAYGKSGEALVDFRGGKFVWTETPVREECPRAAEMLRSMASSLRSGVLVILDYGYEEREREKRFPKGSLMAYRDHCAHNDVLDRPGEQDITFHVNFTRLIEDARAAGFDAVRKERMTQFLMRAGEPAIGEAHAMDALKLKSLLFGFGETFDALICTASRKA